MHTLDDLRKHVETYYRSECWEAFNPKGRERSLPIDVLVDKFISQLPTRTRLFRDYVQETFRQYVLPKLREIKMPSVLSLPCSNGEEAFTLAILGLDNDLYLTVKGMDINRNLIASAKRGELYIPWDRIKLLLPWLKEKHLKKYDRMPNIKVAPHVMERCEFNLHDALEQPVEGEIDAVYCLNLFCYLTETGRRTALSNLLADRREGCILVVDEPYWVPPLSTFRGQPRYNGKFEQLYGWKADLNEFLANLHEHDFGLKQISPQGSSFNVYEKI